MKLVRYTGSEDWSALYIDGKLAVANDHYLVDEKISEIAGVVEINSDAFISGQNGHTQVFETLDEVHENELRITELETRASQLMAESKRLKAEAKRLRNNF